MSPPQIHVHPVYDSTQRPLDPHEKLVHRHYAAPRLFHSHMAASRNGNAHQQNEAGQDPWIAPQKIYHTL